MHPYVLALDVIDDLQVALVGGKGANLAALSHIDGVRVPSAFVVTTHAFDRGRMHRFAMPRDVDEAITSMLTKYGIDRAYAVRSSATAEDAPTTSFAGMHASYLDVVGASAVVEAVRACWASLFTERAIAYRGQHAIAGDGISMAVVVQHMVHADASGVLFTADPLNGNRRVAAIDAVRGRGDAFVSGEVNADSYRLRDGAVVSRTQRDNKPVLTDDTLRQLEHLGRRIEAHFGRPQDIEWCLAGGEIHVVQSRPITTLFPIPVAHDTDTHVYLSVGHQQMMTDAMTPLGIAIRQMNTPAPMHEAGGRLFADVTRGLASPTTRAGLLDMFGRADPLTRDALQTLLDRGGIIPALDGEVRDAPPVGTAATAIAADPAIVLSLVAQWEASHVQAARALEGLQGVALLDGIAADMLELRRVLFDATSHQAIMAGMDATWWLNEHLQTWLGEKSIADTLTLSAPGNITSQMGLDLLDVADVIRPHAQVVAYLQHACGDAHLENFLHALPALDGGRAAHDAIVTWLDRYGMRGAGEIDITRPRWGERPCLMLPMLLANIAGATDGESARRVARGQEQFEATQRDVLTRLRAQSDGDAKVAQTTRMIDALRTFIGYREYPKYGMMCRYAIYRRALLAEGERLAQSGVLRAVDDMDFLIFDELRDVVRMQHADHALIRGRREVHATNQRLSPPRVLTSEGECLHGSLHRANLPHDALIGLPASAGIVEGRARIVLDVGHHVSSAPLEPGDILVTRFTDPSWTPLFLGIAGLVTDVGGPMTHGAVIAREYGLPAVVAVERATERIRDGQRIRIDGADGVITLLD